MSLAAAHRILRHGPQPAICRIGVEDRAPVVGPMSALLVGAIDRFGGGLELVPASQLRSGTFAALWVSATTRRAMLDTLVRVRTGRALGRHARRFSGLTRVEVRANRLVGAFGDGEWLGLRYRMVIRIVPAALQALVPQGSRGAFAAAPAQAAM
jgi:diacylglycerol kinase family enzyme